MCPPDDGGGVYSLPVNYVAVTGDTITAAQHNDPLTDIQSALNARLNLNGSKAMTGALPMGGNRITGLGNPTADADALNRVTGDARYLADMRRPRSRAAPLGTGTGAPVDLTAAQVRAILGSNITLGTITGASGTAVDFTGLPADIKRLKVSFSGCINEWFCGPLGADRDKRRHPDDGLCGRRVVELLDQRDGRHLHGGHSRDGRRICWHDILWQRHVRDYQCRKRNIRRHSDWRTVGSRRGLHRGRGEGARRNARPRADHHHERNRHIRLRQHQHQL
jgi:hypothetical protein